MLIWYERKILLAGWLTSQLNRAINEGICLAQPESPKLCFSLNCITFIIVIIKLLSC